jgi:hypothetical protein
MWRMPVPSWVCILDSTPLAGSSPMSAGSGFSRPLTYMCSSAWMWNFSLPPGGIPISFKRCARCAYSGCHGGWFGSDGGWLVCNPGPEMMRPGGVSALDPQPAASSASNPTSVASEARVRLRVALRWPIVGMQRSGLPRVVQPDPAQCLPAAVTGGRISSGRLNAPHSWVMKCPAVIIRSRSSRRWVRSRRRRSHTGPTS